MATVAVLSPAMVTAGPLAPSPPRSKTPTEAQGRRKPSKRLTLHFPILSPNALADRQSTKSPTTPRSASRHGSPSLRSVNTSPSESVSFLTTLAAQERLVLELKEELQRAEVELSRLKRQWAQLEAGKKKDEIHQVERMRPLTAQSFHMDGSDENAGMTSAAALKASLENGTDRPFARRSTQRVFAGSRHTRALSLLPPNACGNRLPRSPSRDGAWSPALTATDTHSRLGGDPCPSRSSLDEQRTSFSRTYKLLASPPPLSSPTKEVFMHNGKKIASDFRAGLFTFFEDIRQATVGDEGVNGTESRIHSKRNSARITPNGMAYPVPVIDKVNINGRSRGPAMHKLQTSKLEPPGQNRPFSPTGGDEDQSFWNEFDPETPAGNNRDVENIPPPPPPPPKDHIPNQTSLRPAMIDADDNWDVWSSPVPSKASPRVPAPESERKKHRDREKERKRKPVSTEGLPWPELKKLNPARLSRTVSDLVKEWESPAPSVTKDRPAGLEDLAVASPHI